jgi:hypothetical protein
LCIASASSASCPAFANIWYCDACASTSRVSNDTVEQYHCSDLSSPSALRRLRR